MKIKSMALVTAAMVALTLSPAIAATPKPGVTCTKLNASAKVGSKFLTCSKVKGKLVWAAAAVETVRIIQATTADFSDVGTFKAIELMKAKGMKVTISNVNDPASALRAVIAGQGDIVLLAPGEAATAVGNGGANVKYIDSLYGATNYVLLAKNGLNLQNLAGATLAIASMGSAGQVIMAAALTKAGVDMSKIKYVTVGGTSARVTAILAGKVDLAPALAPSAIPAVKTGKVHIILNAGATLGPLLQQGVIANGTWLAKNRKTAQDMVNSFIDAERWANSDMWTYQLLAQKYDLMGSLAIDDQVLSWQQLVAGHFFAVNGAMCQASLDATLNYSYASGGLVQAKMPPQKSWFDPTYVQNYLKSKHQPIGAC
jgi:ABC-type nitrate/sulfonate/bicarbonate transport system substrate-binding protein